MLTKKIYQSLIVAFLAFTGVMLQAQQSISGTVYETDGSTAVVGAAIFVDAADSGVVTDASGVYTVSGLVDGDHDVVPVATGLTFQFQTVTISGADVFGIDFKAQETHAITGAILDDAGVPLENVIVDDGNGHNGLTDGTGKYVIGGLVDGDYTLTATLTGYTFTASVLMPVTISGTDISVDFTGTATSTTYGISGLVTDVGASQPLSGVDIALTDSLGTPIGSTTTNVDGKYSFDSLTPGKYIVIPTMTDYIFSPDPADVEIVDANITDADFDAQETHAITGAILDNAGAALENVVVDDGNGHSGLTDSTGKYVIGGLVDGDYTLTATLTGYTFTASVLMPVSISGTDISVDFTGTATSTTYSISGTVTNTDTGVGEAGIDVGAVDDGGAPVGTATTDASGVYTITGLSNGDYTVAPVTSGYTYTPTSTPVTITDADMAAIDFDATPSSGTTYGISGLVTDVDAGQPLSGVDIALADSLGTPIGTTTTNVDGKYSFDSLTPGKYIVIPSMTNYTFTPDPADVEIVDANITDADFDATPASGTTYSISGTVTNTDTGVGEVGIDVGAVDDGGVPVGTATTDASGVYTITGLSNGDYTVAPVTSGYTYTPTSTPVTIADADMAAIDFDATPVSGTTYSISGTVTNTDTALGESGISVVVANSGGTPAGSTSTDASGDYTITGLLDGDYTVSPVSLGYTYSAPQNVTIAGGDVTGIDFDATPKVLPALPVTSDLVLWLDGADPNGDGSLQSGGPLPVWKDKSTEANDALADAGKEMLVSPTGLAGWSQLESTPGSFYKLTNEITDVRTVFWVVRENAYDADNPHFLLGHGLGADGSDWNHFEFSRAADGSYWDGPNAASEVKNGSTYNDGVLVADPKTTPIPLGKYNLISLVTTGPVAADQITEDRVLNRSWDGSICEIIIYNAELSDTDRQAVETYLRDKWGAPAVLVKGNDIIIGNRDSTPSVDDGTDFGLPIYQGDSVDHTFNISNSGLVDMDINSINITGDAAFVASVPQSSVVAPGTETTFTVSFTAPSDDAEHIAIVEIDTNDPANNPYTFTVKASATTSNTPNMIVNGNGIEIVNGDTTPDQADNTDFGTTGQNTTVVKEFVIENVGTMDLNLTDTPDAVVISKESEPGVFTISVQPTSPVTPGTSVNFSVSFSSGSAGDYSATVSIANDDPNKDPYTFDVKASVATDIPLTVPGLMLWFDGSDPNGDGLAPVAGEIEIIKDKSGNGNDASQTEVSMQAKVVPDSIGANSVLSFDGVDDTYSFSNVSGGRTFFWVLNEKDFTSSHFFLGHSSLYQFSRGENGAYWHSIYADNAVKSGSTYLDGVLVADSLTEAPPVGKLNMISLVTDVPTSPLETDQLTLDRGIPGRSWSGDIAEVLIYDSALSDTDREKIEQYLKDKWSAPKITVKGNGQVIVSGDTTPEFADDTDFGQVLAGGTGLSKTYTIYNDGNADLEITSVRVVDSKVAPVPEFSVDVVPSAPIAPGMSDNVTITFTPTAAGVIDGTVIIDSNDQAIPAGYRFAVKGEGTATAAPIISVLGNGNVIANGDTTPSTKDDTDFGSCIAGTAVIKEFTIENLGSAILNIQNVIVIDGTDFALLNPPASTVAPNGGSTTFKVIFQPSSVGGFNGQVQIETDDPNVSIYTFDLLGESVENIVGVIPGLTLWLDGADPAGDGSTPVAGPLAVWNDKALGNDAEQNDANLQPVVTDAAINGLPAVTFDGQGDFMSLLGAITDIRTVFWVVNETQIGDPAVGDQHFLLGDSQAYDFHRGDASLWNEIYASNGIKNGKTYVDGVEFDGLHNNITAGQNVLISLVSTENLSADQITQDRNQILRSWYGNIAEIIIYNRELSDAERLQVEGYLHNKWNVGVAPDAYTVSGTVSGDVAEGVAVTLSGATTTTVQTDANGDYSFSNVIPGTYTLTAVLGGYDITPASIDVEVIDTDLAGNNFTATTQGQTYSISGIVVDGAGNPVPGVDVTAGNAATVTDGTGKYILTGLINGDYTVTPAGNYTFTPVSTDVTIADADVTDIDFTATSSGPTTYSISGTILDDQGSPVENVEVSDDQGHTVSTDIDGKYTISNLGNGDYTLTAVLLGYEILPASGVTMPVTVADADVSDIDFTATLLPTYTLTVVGGQGGGDYPESRVVQITADAPPAGKMFDAWIGDITTLDDATLAVTNVTMPAAPVTVEATYKDIPAGTSTISGTISGDIVDGVLVTLGGDATATASTDSTGAYSFPGLSNGDYTVTPTASGFTFTPGILNETIADADITDANFVSVAATYSISGTVKDDQGVALENVEVSDGSGHSAITNVDGDYVISGLDNGNYTLTATLLGYTISPIAGVTMPVTIADADVADINFVAVPLRTYTLTVVGGQGGGDYPEATVVQITADAPPAGKMFDAWIGDTTTLDDATLAVTNVTMPAAPVTVEATYKDIPAGTYSISGTILDSDDNPFAGVQVSTDTGETATTDSNGEYHIVGLIDGTYTVTPMIMGSTFEPTDQTVTINGVDETGVDFKASELVAPGYNISGTIIDVTGAPLAGVTVSTDTGETATTINNGEYVISGLDNGNYTVTPELSGYTFVPENVSVTIADADVDSVDFSGEVISGEFSISGTVLDADGNPLENVSVKADAAHAAMTDVDGVYGITGLVDGTYSVVPDLNGYAFTPAVAQVTIVDTDIVDVDFTARVNIAPVANDDPFFTVIQDTALTVPVNGVLANDTDADTGDTLTAHLIDDVQNGTLTLALDGSFTYTPDNAFVGTDTFTYVANDGTVDSNIANVTIEVKATGSDNSPIALDDQYAVIKDDILQVDASGILANDIGTSLSANLVTDVQNGTLEFNADGSFTYTPADDFTGSDSFTYTANDGTLDSNTATVMITVTAPVNPPIAVDDSYSVETGKGLTVAVPGVLENDTDPEEDAMTAVLVDDVTNGKLTLNADGSFTYTPVDGFTGSDTFTYVANDGTLDSNVATVTITVTFQKVTLGISVSVTPAQAGLPKGGTFDKGKAKIYGVLNGKNLNLKKDKSSTPELVKGTWAKKYALYDKKAVKGGYAAYVNGKVQAQAVPLTVKGKSEGAKFENPAQSVLLVPPEIKTVTVTGTTITVTGYFFGTKAPKLALEPETGGKLAKCKVDKKAYQFDPVTGASTLTATYKTKKAPTGKYWIVLDNKVGIGVTVDANGKPILPKVDIP